MNNNRIKESSDKYIISHGTTAFNFFLSLNEGGKPATSLALSKITPPQEHPTPLTTHEKSLTKFGDILFIFDPKEILKDDESLICTRDCYSMDAPEKTLTSFSEQKLTSLKKELQTYSDLTGYDKLSKLTKELKSDKELKLKDVAYGFINDDAFKMLCLSKLGVEIDVPYIPAYTETDLARYISTHAKPLTNKYSIILKDNESLPPLSEDDKATLLTAYDQYYSNQLNSTIVRFRQNMYKSYLNKSDDVRLSHAMTSFIDLLEASKNATLIVDKLALSNIIKEKVSDIGIEAIEFEAVKAASNIGNTHHYTCGDDFFDDKLEAWEYINDNSNMQSQESLVYSMNEIFSLKAKELKSHEVYSHLDIIEPLFFIGSDDDSVTNHDQSHKPLVAKFGNLYKKIEDDLGFSSTTPAFIKKNLMDILISEIEPNISSLTDLGMSIDDEDSIINTLSDIREVRNSFTSTDLDLIVFTNSYHHVRNLKRDLDYALDIPSLLWAEGRDFYKNVLPLLNEGYRGFNFDSVMNLRYQHDHSNNFDNERIESIIDSLVDAYQNLPEQVPYFEIVMKNTLELDSSKIKSIHVPIELSTTINKLMIEHPFIADKISFYDPKKSGDLCQSIAASGFAIDKEILNPSHPEQAVKNNMGLKFS